MCAADSGQCNRQGLKPWSAGCCSFKQKDESAHSTTNMDPRPLHEPPKAGATYLQTIKQTHKISLMSGEATHTARQRVRHGTPLGQTTHSSIQCSEVS